jgi:hypothetical protein
MEGLPTVEELDREIQEAEIRGDAAGMIAAVMFRQKLLDSQREPVEPVVVDHGALNAAYTAALEHGDVDAMIRVEMERVSDR